MSFGRRAVRIRDIQVKFSLINIRQITRETHIKDLDQVAHEVEEGEHGDGNHEQEHGLHGQEDHRVHQVVASVLVQHAVQRSPVKAQGCEGHSLVQSQAAGQGIGQQHLVVSI